MSKSKIWQADDNTLNPLVEAYTVGDDYIIDQQLLPFDISASLAHAGMLREMGILSEKELQQAKKGLNEILKKCQTGDFVIRQDQEDGHTAIEQYLTDNYGEVGKKIHTGRSRNDQSLVMTRLFMKHELANIEKLLGVLTVELHKKSSETKDMPMPGYTHLQRAMPTTVGVWLDSFRSAFADIKPLLHATLALSDQNPLGSASGFGISNFPMKREFTTEALGFSRTQENPMYCGISRGYFENIVLQTLSPIMILAGKFANDMLLFTTQEFNFASLPKSFTTGSSIMPQKQNYDVFEIMRGNTKVFCSYQSQIQDIIAAIGSGYQRDLQLTKKPFMMGVNLCKSTIELLAAIVDNLQFNEKTLNAAMTKELFVTNDVYDKVNQGMSFREAYMEIKNQWNS